MNSKASSIVFVDDFLAKKFNSMPEDDPIKKGIRRAFDSIRENVFCGRNVKKKLIPRSLLLKYGINNLWIYDLPDSWRLLYSIAPGGKVEIIAAVLDWMSHKEY